MNLYSYIAENNTDKAVEVCNSNGIYEIYNLRDLEDSLRSLLAKSEEKAKEVLNLHPDKDVLLEIFNSNKAKTEPPTQVVAQVPAVVEQKQCSCMRNAAGVGEGNPTTTQHTSLVNQTNTYILLGAVIVSLAIISMKK
jgi:hypothetical protein